MESKKNVNLDSYFEFLKQYFSLFHLTKIKRKKVIGNNFKL